MTVDDRQADATDLPETPLKRPLPIAGAFLEQKCHAWGLDPDEVQAAIVADPAGDPVCACCEPTADGGVCAGMWRVIERDVAVWIVRCDRCGFEAGVPPQDAKVRAARRMERANLPDRFVGLVFDEDDDNRDALFLARAWLADYAKERALGKDGTPGLPAVAFWGEPHTGKTHLLIQMCVQIVHKLKVDVRFWTVPELLRELQRFDDDVVRTEAWERARTVDVLALDDLGAERISDWRLEQLAELIDARYLAEKPILLTTNYPPKRWDEILDERSRDRLLGRSMVLPVQLRGRDRRQTQLGEGQ